MNEFLDELQKRLLYIRNHSLASPVSDSDILGSMREIVDIQLSLVKYLNNPLPNFVTDFGPPATEVIKRSGKAMRSKQ